MRKMSFATLFVAVVSMSILLPASSAFAQAARHDHQQQAQEGALKKDGMKMGGMKMGPAMIEEMAAKKRANTERINALMATVKSATGEARVAAMADVVALLIEERAAMQEHCAAMMAMMKK